MITPELIAEMRAALEAATPESDAELVCLLRNHAPALLDEIERLRKENDLQHSQLLNHAQNVLPDRDATIERLRKDNGQLKDDKDQMEIGNVALMQRVAELEVANAVLKEKLRTAEDFNENYTVIDDIGPLPKCFHCAHQQSMAFRGPDAPCYQCGIADGYPKFEEDAK